MGMSKTLGSVAIAALGAAAALGGCGEDEVPFGDTGAGGASSSMRL